MKKIVIYLLVLLLLINLNTSVVALTQDEVNERYEKMGAIFEGVGIEAALRELNETIPEENGGYIYRFEMVDGKVKPVGNETRQVNEEYYYKYGVIVFGDDEPGPKTQESGEMRFLGVNLYGERVSNYVYPYDIDPPAGANFSHYDWYKYPASNPGLDGVAIADITENGYNPEDYLAAFLFGMEAQHGLYYEEDSSVHWPDVYHVVTPPTENTNGLARLFFESVNGGVRYIDVILVADVVINKQPIITITHNGEDVTNNGSTPISVSTENEEAIDIEVTVHLDDMSDVDMFTWTRGGSHWHDSSPATLTWTDSIPFGTTSMGYTVTATAVAGSLSTYGTASASVHTEIIEHTDEEITLYLNYNELSANFSYPLNNGEDIELKFGDRNWTEPIDATLDIVVQEKEKVNDNLQKNGDYLYTYADDGKLTPVLTFRTDRLAFGDDPLGGNWAGNGNLEESFTVSAQGEDYREYVPPNFTGLVLPQASTSFTPTVNGNVKIVALTYNGQSVGPTKSIPTGEAVVHDQISRNIEWRGHSIPFTVFHEMTTAEGATIPVPGQYTRYFRPDNSGSVTFTPLPGKFQDLYRYETYDPQIDIVGLHINAPYTTTTDAKATYYDPGPYQGMHTVKSGYFYEIQGAYQAVVNTTVYIEPNQDTGHQALVDSVMENFKIISNIPTVDSPDEKNSELPWFENTNGIKQGNILVNIGQGVTDVTTEVMDTSKYNSFMESTPAYLYEEEFLGGNAIKVTESTVITFTIPKQKKYIAINAPDGLYYMLAYIAGYSLPESYIGGSHSGDLEVAEIPQGATSQSNNYTLFKDHYIYDFLIEGNMYEDTNAGD